MKILITGANGNISWYFVQLAINSGYEVYAIGRSFNKVTRRSLPKKVKKIECDLRNIIDVKEKLGNLYFDVVCDFICYNKKHAEEAIELYKNITNHYIFISSEAIYERENKFRPFNETTPFTNSITSNYIKGKIEAEYAFQKAFEDFNFPITILRPSFTYDTLMPTSIGLNCYTAINRYKNDNIVLIAGDGNNLWSFTHSKDFATALLGIINNQKSIGQDYNLVGDVQLTWNKATDIIIEELQLNNPQILYVPKEIILNNSLFGEYDLINQRITDNIFDNSKLKNLLPSWSSVIDFKKGISETIKWLEEDSSRQRINPTLDDTIKELYKIGKK